MTTEFPDEWVEPYDLFISYCRDDDKLQQVTAIAQEIETGHADFALTQPLKVFFDSTRPNCDTRTRIIRK